MPKKTRKPIFQRLKTGLEEAIAHAKGELPLKTTDVRESPPDTTKHAKDKKKGDDGGELFE